MKNPNVVLMIAHDLGRHLGCCGVDTVSSPNADALAAESALFTNNFCTAPQCSPSRAAIMTGRYPHSNGMLGLAHKPFNWKLNAGERHIAHLFSDAGYRTVLCGHQHVTQDPKSVGFGEVLGAGGNAIEVGKAAAEVISSRSPKKPLYMQIGFFEPHRPYDFKGALPDESKGVYVPGYLPDTTEARGEFAALQGAVRRMDEGVGLVMDAVRRHLPAENTIVVFTTDHGIAMFRAKCTLYDSGIETAFILRAPGVKSGAREELVSNEDVLPTLLELAGLPPAENAQGASLAPLLRGDKAFTPRSEVFAEMSFHTAYTPMRAVRTAGWKLIRSFEHSWPVDVPTDIQHGPLYGAIIKDHVGHRPYAELYDLRADPLEQHDLAEKPGHAGVLADLSARLLRWMSETDDFLLTGPVPSPFYHESMRRLQEDAARAC